MRTVRHLPAFERKSYAGDERTSPNKSWGEAKAMTEPVLGVDDFAIKKGQRVCDRMPAGIAKNVQHTLSSWAKAHLKSQHLLLNPPADALNGESRKRLGTLLGYNRNRYKNGILLEMQSAPPVALIVKH
jgi:hypothetical protein